MEDLLLDRVGNRYFPHAYFSARNVGMLMVLVSAGAWVVYGWDSTMEQTFFSAKNYGNGIHWSTVMTFFLAIYIFAVNAQLGGLKSFREFGAEVNRDFETLGLQIVILAALAARRKQYAKDLWRNVRASYSKYASLDPARGFAFSVTFAFIAALLFEAIWVPIYDFVNFGSWTWPVYYFNDPWLGNPFLSSVFFRNNILLLACGGLGAIFLYLALDGEFVKSDFGAFWNDLVEGNGIRQRFKISWRVDRYWACLLLIAGGMWGLWVFMPHNASNPIQGSQLILPTQSLFPQTVYTYYNASSYLQPYSSHQMSGFYQNEPSVHLVNVLTKFATFAAVCYPALVRVKKN